MKRFALSLLFMAGSLLAQAQDYGQALTIRIWDNSTAPHSNGITTPETRPAPGRIGNVSTAELFVFPADPAKATGLAAVVCPGGGYARLAMDHEGYDVAKWLAVHGITAAVLKYRMPAGHPEVPIEDAEQAIRIMKGEVPGAGEHATERVGIVGFSAGGHLAAMTSTLAAARPDFALLFYPVITATKGLAHKGSFDRLTGTPRDAELAARYSLEHRVTPLTPPTLLLLSDDDRTVPPANSTLYYNALKSNGVEASMHIYPTGGHGWGIRDDFKYKTQWQDAVINWLEQFE